MNLGAGAEAGREELRAPESIENLHAQAAVDAPQDGERPQAADTRDAFDDDHPSGQCCHEAEDVEQLVRQAVDEAREAEGDDDHHEPSHAAQHVGILVAEAAGRLIDKIGRASCRGRV